MVDNKLSVSLSKGISVRTLKIVIVVKIVVPGYFARNITILRFSIAIIF
jgi:hypothetical protein